MNSITLYRPVGIKELELIIQNGFKAFPPRLEWQPIFYPVMNEEYAIEIALKWNTTDEFSGYSGFVTAFDMDKKYIERYKIQNVGGKIHNELWVPAEELEDFNLNILGRIRITKSFLGKHYVPTTDVVINEIVERTKIQ